MALESFFKYSLEDDDAAIKVRRSCYNTISKLIGSLPPNQDHKLIDTKSSKELNRHSCAGIRSLILARVLYMIRLSKCKPIHGYFLRLLIPKEKACLIIVDDFINTPWKTMAHLNSLIVSQMARFFAVQDEFYHYDRDHIYFGHSWKFFNKSSDTHPSCWPDLVSVSFMHVALTYPKILEMKFPFLNFKPDYLSLLYKRLKPEFLMYVPDPNAVRDSDLFLKAMYGN